MKPRNIAGAIARGTDFWGRAQDVEGVWQLLERGSVLLAAPRRYGKSSLMCALLDAPRPAWSVVYLDVEYVDTPAGFLTELTAALLQQDVFSRVIRKAKDLPGALTRWLAGAVEEIGIGEAKLKLREGLKSHGTWEELAEQLLNYLKCVDGFLLLIIDEFPMMIANFLDEDERQALQFLKWFRAQRGMHATSRVRFLLGGSVNIEPRLEQLHSQALLNDLERFRLLPLSEDQAVFFVREVLEGEGAVFEEHVPKEIVRAIGTGVPFFLQVLISEYLAEARRSGTTITSADVAKIYSSHVLGPAGRARFSHYHSRLKVHYGAFEDPARIVLAELTQHSVRTAGELRLTLLQRGHGDVDIEFLFGMLEGDYYISREADIIQFSSRFLRDWWLRNAPGPRRLA